jgi:ABC-2 type transport system ATP-binding protein
MRPFVEVSEVTFFHKHSGTAALDKVNLTVAKGDRFGLFGPNGAGKTTLLSLISGLRKTDAGHISINDCTPGEIKNMLGYVPQDFAFYSELSPMENLAFFGAWCNVPKQNIRERSEEVLHVLGLADVRNKAVKSFSGGMKRRVNLAIGVIHNPMLLILDEPTTGVDVQSRNAIVEYLRLLNEQGTTLIYTSHHLREAEELCNNIVLIDEGKIIAGGTVSQLIREHAAADLETLFLKLTGRAYRDV